MPTHRRSAVSQDSLLRDILAEASRYGAAAAVRGVLRGSALVAVDIARAGGAARTSGRLGLASRGVDAGPPGAAPGKLPASALELASWLTTSAPGGVEDAASVALAATGALLPPPPAAAPAKAQEIIYRKGAGRRVAVVGHFPFVESMGADFARLDVLEIAPRPGDLPAEAAGEVLPLADVVAVTATTLLNGTLAGLLALIPPRAYVLLLGPSTPFAACLFDLGVDAVCGARVVDPALAAADIVRGLPFKALRGVESLVWLREEKK